MSKELNHIHSSGDCLTEKTLFDYIDNKLSQKERHIVEKHLLDCEMCSDALEGLELVKDRGRITLIKDEINKRILSATQEEAKIVPFNYKMIFSIAATIALLVVGVFLFNKINLKEDVMSGDMAELKENVNSAPALSPPPPPVTVNPSAESEPTPIVTETLEESNGPANGLKDEVTKSSPNKTVLNQDILQAEQQKPGDYYKNGEVAATESKNEVAMDEIAIPAAGTAVFETTITPADDRKKDNLEKAPAAPKSSTADYERDSKLADKKKSEEKVSSGAGTNVYSYNSPDQNNKQQDVENRNTTTTGNTANTTTTTTKNNQGGENLELAKKSEKRKDGTYRSENKPDETSGKTNKTAGKESSRANEDGDIAFGGVVGYEPESVVKEREKLKETEDLSTISAATPVVLADSVVAALVVAEVMPEYPGGNASMLKFIAQNFNYDQTVDKTKNQSTNTKIQVQFIVDKDGTIREPKIIKGIDPKLDKEAIRVIKSMPKWTPGKQNGKAVPVLYKLPIQLEIK